jgi:ATP-dependent RNA helicase DDX51/DBP6
MLPLLPRFLVIDEADRMMSTIQQDGWLTALETAVYTRGRARPPPHLTAAALLLGPPAVPLQKLLFSATLSQDPELLEQLNLFEPKLFRCVVPARMRIQDGAQEAGEFSLPSTLRQEYLACDPGRRPLLVSQLVKARGLKRVLVFTHQAATVHRLALLLANLGHATGELHSQVKHRRKLLNQLEAGGLQLLVCSDALARGIDIASLDGVISYDAPSHLKTYVHRAGRTARAGGQGTAITLCEANQVKGFLKMLRDGNIAGVEKVEVAEAELEAAEEGYKQSVEKTKTDLEEEKNSKQKKNTKRKLEKAKQKFNPIHMKRKS